MGALHSSRDFSSCLIFLARTSETLLILSIPTPRLVHSGYDGLLNVCSRGLTHLDCILALEGVPALCPPPWDLVSLGSVSWGWEPAVGVGLFGGGAGAKSASLFRISSRWRQPQSLCVLGKGPLKTLAKACMIFPVLSVCVVCVGTCTRVCTHGVGA